MEKRIFKQAMGQAAGISKEEFFLYKQSLLLPNTLETPSQAHFRGLKGMILFHKVRAHLPIDYLFKGLYSAATEDNSFHKAKFNKLTFRLGSRNNG